jgi:hypothetical protein
VHRRTEPLPYLLSINLESPAPADVGKPQGADHKTLAPPARLCAMSNPVVFMDITIGGAAAGRLTFEVRE